jgi:GDPmannose 4,6-dehydratase
MTKTALITGVSGQDGAYLAKALLDRDYRVVGTHRRHSSTPVGRLEELAIAEDVELIHLELLEDSNVRRVLQHLRPDEIYNLAAQSFVGLSFEQPLYTCDVDALGVMRILEAMREVCPEARLYQASTSEMFGKVTEVPQTERTPFYPRSPYAIANSLLIGV